MIRIAAVTETAKGLGAVCKYAVDIAVDQLLRVVAQIMGTIVLQRGAQFWVGVAIEDAVGVRRRGCRRSEHGARQKREGNNQPRHRGR